jgi:hypothetical protein
MPESPNYSAYYNVISLKAVNCLHPIPAIRGVTRYSDLTATEIKQIILDIAGGNLHTMSRLTGVRPDYFVNTIRGYFSPSWKRADIIRGAKQRSITPEKENTVNNASKTFDLSGLNESLRREVESLIEQGRLTLCDDCPNFFDPTRHAQCPNCAEKAKKEPDTAKARKATVSIIKCGNPDCHKTFPEWRGKKYCKQACKSKVAAEKARARLAAARDKAAAQKPVEPTQKPEAQERIPLRGNYIGLPGSNCHVPTCNGTLELKSGRFGPFYGCSNFFKENRPSGTPKCRATAIYAPVEPPKPTPKPEPAKAKVKAVATSSDIAEKILLELRKISGELADCIGRVAQLEKTVKGNNELTASARREVSDLDDKVDGIVEILKELGA